MRAAIQIHTIAIRRDLILKGLLAIVVLLGVASLFIDLSAYRSGYPDLWGWRSRFDVDGEANIPTLYSTVLILGAAVLSALVGLLTRAQGGRDRLYWYAIAWILVVMATDEAVPFHNWATEPVRHLFGTLPSGLRFAWVIPALGLTALVSMVFLKFFLRLPPRTRFGIALSAAVYVGGAIGMEMLAGVYMSGQPVRRDVIYIIIFTLEETMEMAGMILYINALLEHIEGHWPEARWIVRSA